MNNNMIEVLSEEEMVLLQEKIDIKKFLFSSPDIAYRFPTAFFKIKMPDRRIDEERYKKLDKMYRSGKKMSRKDEMIYLQHRYEKNMPTIIQSWIPFTASSNGPCYFISASIVFDQPYDLMLKTIKGIPMGGGVLPINMLNSNLLSICGITSIHINPYVYVDFEGISKAYNNRSIITKKSSQKQVAKMILSKFTIIGFIPHSSNIGLRMSHWLNRSILTKCPDWTRL